MSFIKFKEWGIKSYSEPFEKQLKQILKAGHDVQLHLHPHWLGSSFKNGRFNPSGKYTLASFAKDPYPLNIEGIIETGTTGLNKIGKAVFREYKCIAFRAGGYALAPETSRILHALYKNGIRFDSSICRGYYYVSDNSLVDYRRVPGLPNWYLPFNGDLSQPGNDKEGIFEIPIAGKPKGLFEMPTSFKLRKYQSRAVENRGKIIHTTSGVSKKEKIKQLLSSRMLTVDNHTYSPEYMMKILDYNVKKYIKHDEMMLSLIGHPKSMDSYHYHLLSSFVKKAREKYGNMLSFVTFKDVFENK
ncbi:MAG: hypothetical protein GXO86_12480 [Chlorobi bacterium]|nr:hypothetical protein [Chlorobiota bacterium]